ncbi:MAG: hypothetical protein ACOZNI_07455 [Myxococcota bacterium]
MILAVVAALAQESVPCDPTTAVAGVRAGEKEAYLCLAETDAARDAIVAAIDAGGEHPERLTRALALWLLHHDDAEWDPALVRRLNPSDRRLLSDGVRARRGRKSPVPEHDRVFSQFAWYRPSPGYTDTRLRPVDRANVAMADKPPPAPAAPVEEAPAPAPAADGCGCDHAGAIVLLPLLWRRRRC